MGGNGETSEQFQSARFELKRFVAGSDGGLDELEHVEGGSEHGGVGEGAELPDGGGELVGAWVEVGEEGFGEGGEVALLAGEAGGGESEGATGGGESGEVGVGGEVPGTGLVEGMVGGLVLVESLEGAGGPGGGVVVGLGVAVVDEEEKSGFEGGGEGGEEVGVFEADFGEVAFRWWRGGGGEGVPESWKGEGGGGPEEGLGVAGDAAFLPLVVVPLEEVNGEGVDDFVGEDGTEGEVEIRRGGEHGEAGFGGVCEAGLEGAGFGPEGLDGVVMDGLVEGGIEGGGGGEDVQGEIAGFGARFEEVEGGGGAVGLPEGMEAGGEEFAEGATDADAGDEVAFSPHPDAVGSAVVTPIGVIEGLGHEGGEGQGALPLDAVAEVRGQERSCPLRRWGVNRRRSRVVHGLRADPQMAKRKSSNRRIWHLFKRKGFWVFVAICGVSGLVGLNWLNSYLDPYRVRAAGYDIPRYINDIEEPSLILNRNGEEIGRLFVENRSVIPVEEVPQRLIDALMAQEDQRFFEHEGVDWVGILRAIYLNVKARDVNQGASTVTMQLARNAFNLKEEAEERGEGGIQRKIVEAFLALRIEEYLNAELPSLDGRRAKMQILEYYLNRIPFGSGYYGVRSASLGYFGKEPKDLTTEECCSLIACVKNPTGLTPLRYPERNKKARDHVLNRMRDEGMITKVEWAAMTVKPVKVNPRPLQRGTSHLYEKVAGLARAKVGIEAMSRGDFRIYTTIDRKLQMEAEEALERQLARVEQVPGYTHPRHVNHQPEEGTMPPYLQGAALMVESGSGRVLAHVGGRDFVQSQYDFIESGRRPLGTAFLPFIYAAAFADGWSASSSVSDEPMDNRAVMVGGREGILGEWGMETSAPVYEGRIPARRSLAASKIAASVRLGREVGLEEVVAQGREFGLDFKDTKMLNRLYLGTEPTSLRDGVLAYSAFGEGGKIPKGLRYIDRIENERGEVVYKAPVGSDQMRDVAGCDAATAYQIHSILHDTVRTGNLAEEETKLAGGSFAGGVKTGTTDSFSDGWCFGYNGKVTLGMWVGFLDGGREAIYPGAFGRLLTYPAWAAVMNTAEELYPGREIPVPDSLELVSVCSKSGLLGTRYCYDTIEDPEKGATFRSTVYKEFLRKGQRMGSCDVHGEGGLAVEDVLKTYGPQAGEDSLRERLTVAPIRPKAPALIGSDPYGSVVLSLAPGDESGGVYMSAGSVLWLDNSVRGEEEASLKLPRPKKLEIGVD